MRSDQLWAAYATFEVRRLDVTTARKIFGAAIGMCPKPKLFVEYIEMELHLREFDRCRTLYQKFLEVSCLGVVCSMHMLTTLTTIICSAPAV
jgi:hypothetical protein